MTSPQEKEEKTLFILGGSGYIGTQILAQAQLPPFNYAHIRALSRTPETDTHLLSHGATPIRGDLTSLDTITTEARGADAVIMLATAYIFGVTPSYDDVMSTDQSALSAIGAALSGTAKPLAIASGTLLAAPSPTGEETTEESPLDPSPINTRGKTDAFALALGQKLKFPVVSIRLAPYVYGRGGSGIGLFMAQAEKEGRVVTVNGGGNRTTVVHVDDAAHLFLLAVERHRKEGGGGGEVYNASADTTVTAGQIFGAVAGVLRVPVADVSGAEARAAGMDETVLRFLTAENRASGDKARRVLGWRPSGPGILRDISQGSYCRGGTGWRGEN
ncbi:oxidoreductase domain-containing protein [Aspergillus homomorphus CBS 101889]|uniref:Oxidoreductase domain-containing protein n=1 Tax=Aspergillus homomorphus (strain CBS 101889) TaxID=1450537 RepID=A0A395I5V0_ASPHC|nr:oxidoreductase domain-containing protein [Aspergillus homomorphus CBS 101889]RAL15156.1 oxidoreductase domain-containing protein [Aspergillus homomorphus CBS 101889]